MVELDRAPRIPSIRPEYNTFLYATIGADPGGSELTVLSAMARMNVDPWQEAAKLAELPAKAATGKLASLIAALPGGPSTPDEPGLIAARLIKLLPQQSRLSLPMPQQNRLNLSPQLLAVVKTLSSTRVMYVILVLIGLTLGAKWFVSNKPQIANVQTSTSEAASPRNVPLSH
jgi:hypothetical protein